MSRIDKLFARLKKQNKTAFIAYIMGGDPDIEASLDLMQSLPDAGVDIIELGFPFTDPVADGSVIEEAGLRALQSGASLKKIINMVAEFRKTDANTPIILMGYANPVYIMGYADFAKQAFEAGVDGAIIVDLPPEEDQDLRTEFEKNRLDLIRLATPTSNDERLEKIAKSASGFIYYVSVAGITGAGLGEDIIIANAVAQIKKTSNLPVVVGFGIKTPAHAEKIARHADGVVVGSAIVREMYENGKNAALQLVGKLSASI